MCHDKARKDRRAPESRVAAKQAALGASSRGKSSNGVAPKRRLGEEGHALAQQGPDRIRGERNVVARKRKETQG